jgi:leucyl/phenylalanyl-tRNA---protein transferase
MQVLSSNELWFPNVAEADEEGLLAIGGAITKKRIVAAYSQGIFPWYEGDVPLWWSPDPRFVLYPEKLKVQKSMRPILRNNNWVYKFNIDFKEIIEACCFAERKDQEGTWINDEIIAIYTALHQEGIGICAGAYYNGQLVGGLYGLLIGKVFCGESMFSIMPNASKFAFINLTQELRQNGIILIDCQVYTAHLESLGAEFMPRSTFLAILKQNL